MSEKKVGKRLLTWVLVLVMTLSLLPLNVLADEAGETESQMEQTVNNGDFSMTKRATPNEDGSYNITLSVTPLKPRQQSRWSWSSCLTFPALWYIAPWKLGRAVKSTIPVILTMSITIASSMGSAAQL